MKRKTDTGLWIAVFGQDGVGKSSVIDQLEHHLAAGVEGISRFHFRPRFRRSCESAPPVTQPHGKPPRGSVVSLFKLLYWLADCWWGYLLTIVPRRYRGEMIIFDRYLPDILIDPVRYRLPAGSMPIAAALVKLTPQPDLYVLLDAPADVVQQRKRELSPGEARRQRIAYLKMFESVRSKLLVNADSPLPEVSRRVAVGICSLQSQFLRQPRETFFVPNL